MSYGHFIPASVISEFKGGGYQHASIVASEVCCVLCCVVLCCVVWCGVLCFV